MILNNSTNCNVGVVTGSYNCWGGGYATFRVANTNGSTYCEGVHSRNSGRGFFSVSGSHDCTVGWVDIATTTSQCIFLEDATNTHVLCGVVSGGNPNCQEVRTSGCSINVEGCGGSNCGGSSTTNGTINGTYSIIASHSDKALDTYDWGTTDGTNIAQWSYWGGEAQQFNISTVDGIWHKITPVIATSKAFDVNEISTADGANIQIWEYWSGYGQQFRFQSAGTGVWRIINRNSEKCLDVEGASSSDGANVIQWTCISGATNQMFELINMKSADDNIIDPPKAELIIYPNPASDILTLNIPENLPINSIAIYNNLGKKLNVVNNLSIGVNQIDIYNLQPGIYLIQFLGLEDINPQLFFKD